MARIRAIIDYIKLDAAIEEVEAALDIVADVRPRIRAFVDHVELAVMIEESPFVITWSIWDGGASVWDVVDGVPQSQWDIGLL
jgi:hypothetical protein